MDPVNKYFEIITSYLADVIGTSSNYMWPEIPLVVAYFAPSIVAYFRMKKNAKAIFILNFFLGWTFLGWVGALVWAMLEED